MKVKVKLKVRLRVRMNCVVRVQPRQCMCKYMLCKSK